MLFPGIWKIGDKNLSFIPRLPPAMKRNVQKPTVGVALGAVLTSGFILKFLVISVFNILQQKRCVQPPHPLMILCYKRGFVSSCPYADPLLRAAHPGGATSSRGGSGLRSACRPPPCRLQLCL